MSFIKGMGLFITCGLVGGLTYHKTFGNENQKQENQDMKKYKNEIQNTDSVRYQKVLNEIDNGKKYNVYSTWAKEAEKMHDSLRVDSMVKKAYYEGAQMVRDSIKAAAKSAK